MSADPAEGPKTFAWLCGRHLNRVLDSLARPLHDPDIDQKVWRASIGYQIYAFAKVTGHLRGKNDASAFDLDGDGESDDVAGWQVEDYLDELGDIVSLLHRKGVLSKAAIPTVDARVWFENLAKERFNGTQEAAAAPVEAA